MSRYAHVHAIDWTTWQDLLPRFVAALETPDEQAMAVLTATVDPDAEVELLGERPTVRPTEPGWFAKTFLGAKPGFAWSHDELELLLATLDAAGAEHIAEVPCRTSGLERASHLADELRRQGHAAEADTLHLLTCSGSLPASPLPEGVVPVPPGGCRALLAALHGIEPNDMWADPLQELREGLGVLPEGAGVIGVLEV